MKNHIIQTWLFAIALLPLAAQGQSIRKDYREFTAMEMSDYVTAINYLEPLGGGDISWTFAPFHNSYYCSTHSENSTVCGIGLGTNGPFFLPWHRVFLLEFEEKLRHNANLNPAWNDYLAIPYWDWVTDNTAGWDNSFLAESNFPTLFQSPADDRCLGAVGPSCATGILPIAGQINYLLGLNSFYIPTFGYPQSSASDFSHYLEYWHNETSIWVGSFMDTHDAPLDPAFFLNIAMADKLWQDAEDAASGVFSSFLNPSARYPGYSQTAGGVIDSRYIPSLSLGVRDNDVWYASQGKVLLDGADGLKFVASDVTSPYLYRYTVAATPGSNVVAGGEIYVGDVQRDANNNVIADTKGGFKIDPGVTCDFRAGAAIHFLPGFEASYGSFSEAKIITIPNGLAPETPQNLGVATNGAASAKPKKSLSTPAPSFSQPALKCFPNPVLTTAAFEYSLSEATAVSLSIFDVTGKVVTEILRDEPQEAGTQRVEWDASSFPKGLYFSRLIAGGQTQTIKVTIQ